LKSKFILISLTLIFIFCKAEDFWMKTSFADKAYSVFCPNKDEVFIVSVSGWDTYVSQNMGNTWNKFLDFQIHYVNDTSEKFYITYYDDSLFVVDRNTEEWEFIFKATGVGIDEIYETASNFYIRGYSKLMKADLNWSDIYPVLTVNGGEEITCFAIDSTGTYYAGSTDYFDLDAPGGVYKSYDQGETWTYPDLPNHFVRAMAVDSEGRIFVGTCGHYYNGTGQIYRSEDNGNSWQLVANGVYVFSMAINSEDDIFVGLDQDYDGYPSVFVSQDHGTTWDSLEGGYSGGDVYDLAITPDGYVYLATRTGVYRSINSTTGIADEESSVLIKNCVLFQNYPNPFNNETKIHFSLDSSSEVELNIYNGKGEMVESLVKGRYERGIHSVNYRTDGLTSGVYYYELKVNGIPEQIRKMLYLR
jgi:hypothetical protein